jgi:hypothetical protein
VTHIIGAEHFSVRRVLQQQPFKPERLAKSFLCGRSKRFDLELINIIIPDQVLKDRIEFVEDLDPDIEIRARPFPRIDLAQNIGELVI